MHFMIGTMAQTMAVPERLKVLSGGTVDAHDIDGTLTRLVQFLAGGLRAPLSNAPRRDGSHRGARSPRRRP